jgi:hypothetical protein
MSKLGFGYDLSDKNISRKEAKSLVGEGWHGLIDRIYNVLNHTDTITKVEEKFGGLRVDGAADADVIVTIHQAQRDSMKTCVVCGEPGKMRMDLRSLKTYCDTHYVWAKDVEKMK